MSFFGKIFKKARKIPVIGGVIGTGGVILGKKRLKTELYDKLVRIARAGEIVGAGAVAREALKNLGLDAVADELTVEAAEDGRLKAEVEKISKGQAAAIWVALAPLPT